jgi:hypothetical protein
MSNKKKGDEYEDFVETVYKAILEAEHREGKITPITLERKKIITSASGTPAEIDIYWEYSIAGIKNSVAIECRNYNKNIDIPGVRDFARKIERISGLKGLMVTKKGFSENAIQEASADNIDLLVIRELSDKDWEGRLKQINIHMIANIPSRTINITPSINQEWFLKNGYKDGDTFQIACRNDLLIIEDKATTFKHSLHELESNDFFEQKEAGNHVWEKEFQDGWLHVEDKKMKLDSIKIEYSKPQPIQSEMNINFENYVLAVMEYINGQCDKYLVLKTGERKPYDD